MEITRGKIMGAQKVVVYGPEGIGKSTLASQFPDAVFIDTEGSTKHLDVARTMKPPTWANLLDQIKYFTKNPEALGTLVIDTADWAEQLAAVDVCSKVHKQSIEDFGYGKGYVYLAEEFAKLLNALDEIIEQNINVVLVAHAQLRKFEQPDEMGAYDRYELKLTRKTAPLIKEWADMILFANYETYVVKTEEKKAKAQGGKRVMHTTHHPCWDAKNRHGLPDKMPFEYAQIAHCFSPVEVKVQPKPEPEKPKKKQEVKKAEPVFLGEEQSQEEGLDRINPLLASLIASDGVTLAEVKRAVVSKEYYTDDVEVWDYDPEFVDGVLISAWAQVLKMIKDYKDDVPF